MKDVNEITICRDNYETREEFEDAVKTAVMLLLNEDYILTIHYDEKGLGIICIRYNYADQSMGCDYPYWLSPEEIEQVDFNRKCSGGDSDSESL